MISGEAKQAMKTF